jgi:hypothetical protein
VSVVAAKVYVSNMFPTPGVRIEVLPMTLEIDGIASQTA